jgi:catechol 2,3-dioxygenase-like lactoylglutathione lyase family enzyme
MGSRRAIALAPAEAGCLRVPLAYNGRFPKGIASMSEFLASTFVLAVADLEASRKYYVEELGFVEDLRVDGWSFLRRGACRLRLGDCPGIKPMADAPDHSWFAYLNVSDARQLYAEFVRNGVEIWHPLADKPWGMREFAIVTPDGHRIVFGENREAHG